MQIDEVTKRLYNVKLLDHEVAVLRRYVKCLKNSEIDTVEALIAWMMQSQLDFVLDSLVEEADIKVTDVNPGYTKWQRFFKWVGRL